MRTEEDVRTALERLAQKSPDPTRLTEDLTSRVAQPPRRSRTVPMVIVTALATATAAIAGPLALRHLNNATPRPAEVAAASPWSNWVTLTVPPKWQVAPRMYQRNRQVYQLQELGTPWAAACLVMLHRNGDFDPATIPAGSAAVDVNGKPGRLVTSTDKPFVSFPEGLFVSPFAIGPDWTRPVKTVVWQPAPGIWALTSCVQQRMEGTRQMPNLTSPVDTDSRTALAIARGIRGESQRTVAPFRIGYLPAGMRPDRITELGTGLGRDFIIVLSDGDQSTGLEHQRPRSSCAKLGSAAKNCPAIGSHGIWGPYPEPGSDLEITYSNDMVRDSQTRQKKHDLVIHGYKAWYTTDVNRAYPRLPKPRSGAALPTTGIRLEGRHLAIQIRFLSGKEADKAELRKVAENLTVASDPKNLSTWFDAATALDR